MCYITSMNSPTITLTLDVLKLRLAKVINFPHPLVSKGHIFCVPPGGPGRSSDDTCISITSACVLDLTGNITLGKWVMIGAYTRFWTHEHTLTGREPLLLLEENIGESAFTTVIHKIIGDDVWINESIILAKCNRIARGVIIGAGSVVTRPIEEEYTIWAGVPARNIGHR